VYGPPSKSRWPITYGNLSWLQCLVNLFCVCVCVCKMFYWMKIDRQINVCVHINRKHIHTHKTMDSHSTKQCQSVTQVLYLKSRYANISAVGALYITGNFFLGMSSVSSVTGHVLMSTTLLASCKCPDILLRSANTVFCTITKWWQKKKPFQFYWL